MSKDEKIILVITALLIMAVIVWRKPIANVIMGEPMEPAIDLVGMSQTPSNSNLTKGPSYLMYNQPWAFSPPVNNFLPAIASGEGRRNVMTPANMSGDEFSFYSKTEGY